MSLIKILWLKAVQQNKKGAFWTLVRVVLRVLSYLYGFAIKIRRFFYKTGILKSYKLPAYVISVGNITSGGTGKTPFVIYLSERLKERKVGILSRGYGRDSRKTYDDEDLELSENVFRKVSPDRLRAGRELIEKEAVKIIILDDGFQHLRIKPDINIVLIDATYPFGNKRLLPAGALREPLSSLKHVDIFVITHADLVSQEQLSALESDLKRYGDKGIIRTIHKPLSLISVNRRVGETLDLSMIQDKNVWEFCGIGNPYQFHKTLNSLCTIKGFSIFSDHYYYSTEDLKVLVQKAK
ncbi:MAG: tetraacyldisaccharide 4'-kinase, partial [Planctomycetota bacterium]|nr:tetraacyldisaccharide 4'-kinase [Planctomycetota bacterium]MDI6788710.1 tetraacyldisaccharide 4'-kinase [Planctomycetota bacterium]